MKKIVRILTLVVLFTFSSQKGMAQFQADSDEYRIVAVKNGDEAVQSASNVLAVYKQFQVDMPTAFTPNGDGLNDTFGSVANGVYEYKLVIYDRNGELIFQTDSIDEKWDGTHQGNKVQTGSYVYHVTATGPEAAQINKTGRVMVII